MQKSISMIEQWLKESKYRSITICNATYNGEDKIFIRAQEVSKVDKIVYTKIVYANNLEKGLEDVFSNR